jgi:uncharacterized delta-60 repeat protein
MSPVDPTFNPVPSSPLLAAQQIVQPDGRVIVWSTSLVVDGVAKVDVARLNADGSLDPTFTFGASAEFYLTNLILLPDGRIIAAGSVNGLAKMLRLNQDGSVDNSFVSGFPKNGFGTSFYTVITVQPDGTIFASRRQSNLGYNELTLYRFNQDGSVDNSFTPVGYGTARFFHPFITGLIVLPDGRLYLSDTTTGAFISNAQLRRFNANGAPDATWEARPAPAYPRSTFRLTVRSLRRGILIWSTDSPRSILSGCCRQATSTRPLTHRPLSRETG